MQESGRWYKPVRNGAPPGESCTFRRRRLPHKPSMQKANRSARNKSPTSSPVANNRLSSRRSAVRREDYHVSLWAAPCDRRRGNLRSRPRNDREAGAGPASREGSAQKHHWGSFANRRSRSPGNFQKWRDKQDRKLRHLRTTGVGRLSVARFTCEVEASHK